MDPLTAIGAVASIVQLAQGALSLSKTIYSLGAAVTSASDDIQLLADDLKTFSQSLSLLSRLLEDSKSWYSDDIYLLTAKIIKDCAELYVKIDKVLVKLGGNGKSTWKHRVKFVYKEKEIRKLMKRLRDMKGTLVTILMSLQVDLQLSLLDISTSSRIQRIPEKPLQSETIQTLQDAQKVAQETRFLSGYAIYSEPALPETGHDVLKTNSDHVSQPSIAGCLSTGLGGTERLLSKNEHSGLEKSHIQPNSTVSVSFKRGYASATTTSAASPFQPINMMVHNHISQNTAKSGTSTSNSITTRSLKSTPSVQSFQTAVSIQQPLLEQEAQREVGQHVKAVRSVLHSFKTALDVLSKLVEIRSLLKNPTLHKASKHLEHSLTGGERELKNTYDHHYDLHGPKYVQGFTDSYTTTLERVSFALMKDIVTPLHMYSADHVTIDKTDLEILQTCAEDCRSQAMFVIVNIASSLSKPDSEYLMEPPCAPAGIAANHNPISLRLPTMSPPFEGPLSISWDKLPDSGLAQRRTESICATSVGLRGDRSQTNYRQRVGSKRGRKQKEPYESPPTFIGGPYFPPWSVDEGDVSYPELDSATLLTQGHMTRANIEGDGTGNNINPTNSYPDGGGLANSYSGENRMNVPSKKRELGSWKQERERRAASISSRQPIEALLYSPTPIPKHTSSVDQRTNRSPQASETSKTDERLSNFPEIIGAEYGSITLKGRMNDRTSLDFDGFIEDLSLPSLAASYSMASDSALQQCKDAPDNSNQPTEVVTPQPYPQNKETVLETEERQVSHRKRRPPRPPKTRGRGPHRRKSAPKDFTMSSSVPSAYPQSAPKRSLRSSASRSSLEDDREILVEIFSPYKLNSFQKLWSQAYHSFRYYQPIIFKSLSSGIGDQYGKLPLDISNHKLSTTITALIESIGAKTYDVKPELMPFLYHRQSIVKIAMMISSRLGLHMPIMGWACVGVLFAMYEQLLESSTANLLTTDIEAITQSSQQLQDLVGLLARYAVMENLYHQNGSLSLTLEYEDALRRICFLVVQYFGNAFVVARSVGKEDTNLVVENRARCNELIKEIKRQDKVCQAFRVIVEADEESDAESDDSIIDVTPLSGHEMAIEMA